MAAAMNGMAAARRHDPLRRHLPDLLRLLPAGDPAGGADGPARDLRADPRFDRARRGRPDPSAGRASRGAARDPGPARVPAGRCGRDRGVLGAWRWCAPTGPRAGADPPGAAGAAHRRPTRSICSARGAYVLRGGGRPRAMSPSSPPARRWRSPWQARKRLQAYGVGCAVVSMPCCELFDQQDATYRKEVLGAGRGSRSRRHRRSAGPATCVSEDDVVGMRGFGASAPAEACTRTSASRPSASSSSCASGYEPRGPDPVSAPTEGE